jgi:MFS family permease
VPLRVSTRLDGSVLGIRDFRLLWTGQAISAIGDMVFPVAVAVFVLDSGGDVGDVGLVLATRFAALVLFALFGGVWADRLRRTHVMPSLLVLLVPGVPEFRTPKPAGGSASAPVEAPVGA